jgi:hypothetical protein
MENHQTQSKPEGAEQPSPEGLSSSALFGVGSRCVAFNGRAYIDDKTTPPSMTMQPGTVTAVWSEKCEGRILVDIQFDGDPKISRGHFQNLLKSEPNTEGQTTAKPLSAPVCSPSPELP